MSDYTAPIEDIKFTMREVAGLDSVTSMPGFEEVTPDIVDAVLEEAGKFASGVLGPLNHGGDQEGSKLEGDTVKTPAGFKEAYRQFVEGGWPGMMFSTDWGGMGFPHIVGMAVTEMWDAANTAWSLCPMLTQGAVEVLNHHGTKELQDLYIEKLVSGEWTGTMNLTEPQAGSDVGALRTKAVIEGDHYLITGQKIFITFGDHDYGGNVIHLVLARLPGAPEGTRGISLFIVPKILVNRDGTLGEPNDLRVVSLEHKLGIHASPTAIMSYGDNGGAVGYLIGEENRGMACMFTMMNNARLNVGMLGLGTAVRAYQQARDFAMERVQGGDIAGKLKGMLSIIHHPDVRRMLMSMKASVEAMRGLSYFAAATLDKAKQHPDEAERKRQQALIDLLTPICKAWCTDTGLDVCNTGIQIHGGMGFIEETGAAQHWRDARIHPIYEGTNGIQANDLLGRKVVRDGGETAKAFIATMGALDNELGAGEGEDIVAVREALADGLVCLGEATDWMVATFPKNPTLAAAGAHHYLTLWGNVTSGWLLAKAALAAGKTGSNGDAGFGEAKLKTVRFYADQVLSRSSSLKKMITQGGEAVMALAEEQF
ncbi:MAG: acyl-CoA dehydrogenase [Alphaproteobacteria bacterium]|nr:acyl-CoA dehydrogenase [Alphaproteobacteria bacterium]